MGTPGQRRIRQYLMFCFKCAESYFTRYFQHPLLYLESKQIMEKSKIIMRTKLTLLNSWEPQPNNGQQTQELSHARQDIRANMTAQIPREEHHKHLVRWSLCLPKAHLSIALYYSRENRKLQSLDKDNTVLCGILLCCPAYERDHTTRC